MVKKICLGMLFSTMIFCESQRGNIPLPDSSIQEDGVVEKEKDEDENDKKNKQLQKRYKKEIAQQFLDYRRSVRASGCIDDSEIEIISDIPKDPKEIRDSIESIDITYIEREDIEGVEILVYLLPLSDKNARYDAEIDIVAGKKWQKFFKEKDRLSVKSMEMVRILALLKIDQEKRRLLQERMCKKARFEGAGTGIVLGIGSAIFAILCKIVAKG